MIIYAKVRKKTRIGSDTHESNTYGLFSKTRVEAYPERFEVLEELSGSKDDWILTPNGPEENEQEQDLKENEDLIFD